MKLLAILLLLCASTLAQQYRLPADVHAYAMDKGRALAVYGGDQLRTTDLVLWTKDMDSTNRVVVLIRGDVTLVKVLDGIEMTGLVMGRRIVPETCFGSRGQECLTHPPRLRF